MIVALIALFVALGGVAGAATTMITTQMIKDNAVTRGKIAANSINSAKIEDGSIQSKDLAGNVRGERGVAGSKGEVGPAGAAGARGPAGPSGTPGATGATGETGVQGAAGARGPAGPSGTPGATGATGETGVQGAAGPTGPSDIVVRKFDSAWLESPFSSGGTSLSLKLGTITLGSGSWVILANVSAFLGKAEGFYAVDVFCTLRLDSDNSQLPASWGTYETDSARVSGTFFQAVTPASSTTYNLYCQANGSHHSSTAGGTLVAIKTGNLTFS